MLLSRTQWPGRIVLTALAEVLTADRMTPISPVLFTLSDDGWWSCHGRCRRRCCCCCWGKQTTDDEWRVSTGVSRAWAVERRFVSGKFSYGAAGHGLLDDSTIKESVGWAREGNTAGMQLLSRLGLGLHADTVYARHWCGGYGDAVPGVVAADAPRSCYDRTGVVSNYHVPRFVSLRQRQRFVVRVNVADTTSNSIDSS